jgi:hypothetical protein
MLPGRLLNCTALIAVKTILPWHFTILDWQGEKLKTLGQTFVMFWSSICWSCLVSIPKFFRLRKDDIATKTRVEIEYDLRTPGIQGF